MKPLIPLDSITNVDISIQENHAGTVTICGITKTAAEWRDMASSFSETQSALAELHAMVWGECPSLLNEDSGGCARLDLRIRNLLPEAPK